MKNVNIDVFLIAQTKVNVTEIRRWLDYLNVSDDYVIPTDEIVTDPALLIALAAKRCYKSFEVGLNPNVTKVRSDWTEYLDNVLKSGHGSVCEHATYSFAIEGVSRVFTGEMNRHRAGVAISEGSMRYIRFNDIPYWVPTSIRLTYEESMALEQIKDQLAADPIPAKDITIKLLVSRLDPTKQEAGRLALKKTKTQEIFAKHFGQTDANYDAIQEVWAEELAPTSKFHGKKQVTSMMRRIIPMGVATGGTWTLNIRALRHVLALRASPEAEEEIALVFSKIGVLMAEKEPMLFGDFTQTIEGYWVPKYRKV